MTHQFTRYDEDGNSTEVIIRFEAEWTDCGDGWNEPRTRGWSITGAWDLNTGAMVHLTPSEEAEIALSLEDPTL